MVGQIFSTTRENALLRFSFLRFVLIEDIIYEEIELRYMLNCAEYNTSDTFNCASTCLLSFIFDNFIFTRPVRAIRFFTTHSIAHRDAVRIFILPRDLFKSSNCIICRYRWTSYCISCVAYCFVSTDIRSPSSLHWCGRNFFCTNCTNRSERWIRQLYEIFVLSVDTSRLIHNLTSNDL